MEIHPVFRENRLHDPQRHSELAVYRELACSAKPGAALYEPQLGRNCRGVDFAVWLEGIGRLAIEVKGGQYRLCQGEWMLSTPDGDEPKDNPVRQLWDGAMSLRDCIGGRVGQKPFIVSALVFPDMVPHPEIEHWLSTSSGHVIWGAANLVERLADLAREQHVKYPPTSAEVRREVAALYPGLAGPEEAPTPDGWGIDTRQVIIQHVEHLHLHTSPRV